ncbi:MAG: hypothetical protein AAGD11_00320 [Planctomycetota bacterium]
MRGLPSAVLLTALVLPCEHARGQASNPGLDGNLYVTQVLKSLQAPINVSAKLRFESRLFDQMLVGQGAYQQGGAMSKRFTRWEMHTQIADESASFVQVYDGIHLWTERRLPSRRNVTRLDVARLQSGLRAHQRGKAVDVRAQLLGSVAGQGGLIQLLADLLTNYDFQPPQPTQLNGLPVNALIGRWRTNQLVKHWPSAAQLDDAEPPTWPHQLPHHVLLLVHKQNLFPCVVEHRGFHGAHYATSLAGLRPTSSPQLRYEIHDINFAVAIPNEHFAFDPGSNWSDETSVVLEQMTSEQVDAATAVGAARIGKAAVR